MRPLQRKISRPNRETESHSGRPLNTKTGGNTITVQKATRIGSMFQLGQNRLSRNTDCPLSGLSPIPMFHVFFRFGGKQPGKVQ